MKMSLKIGLHALPIGTLLSAFLVPGIALAGPEDAVSSDGVSLGDKKVANSVGKSGGASYMPSFAGASRVTTEALAREGVDVSSRGRMSAAEFKAAVALPDGAGQGGTEGTEVIIGQDRREQLYTTVFPSRARVLITFSAGRCSGTMIGSNTVLTAGHCLHSGGTSGAWFPTSSYRIYPGANGLSNPYGSCTAKSIHSVTGWTLSKNEAFDYGAIKLTCTVGNTVGFYGWTSSVLLNDPAIIGGYPGDKPLTQWIHADKVRAMTTDQIFYSNDTTPGSSGSGVWWDQNGAILIGVHAYGTHGSSPHSIYNHGKRITASTASNLTLWRNLP